MSGIERRLSRLEGETLAEPADLAERPIQEQLLHLIRKNGLLAVVHEVARERLREKASDTIPGYSD